MRDPSVLHYVYFDSRWRLSEPEWWRQATLLEAVFAAVQRAGLWLDFRFVGEKGSKSLRPFADPREVSQQCTAWESGPYVLHQDAAEDGDGSYLGFSIGHRSLHLVLNVGKEALAQRRRTLIDQLLVMVEALYPSLRGTMELGCLRAPGFSFAQPRPPRIHGHWEFDSLFALLDQALPREDEELAEVQKLLEAPMPVGARREQRGDLVLFRFAQDLVDDAQVAAACSSQDAWVARVLDPPHIPGWNRAGDMATSITGLEPHPPLTFYDPNYQHGYKAVVATDDGEVDEQTLAEVAAWLRAGRLPDGTPLAAMRLIVPRREAALRLFPQVQALGVDRVFYPDNRGRWWDPFPPGRWLELTP